VARLSEGGREKDLISTAMNIKGPERENEMDFGMVT
jgi:hypothetical protein